jgi:hypothetical protein
MCEIYISQTCTNVFGKKYTILNGDSLGRTYSIKGLHSLINQGHLEIKNLDNRIQIDLESYLNIRRMMLEQQKLKTRKSFR